MRINGKERNFRFTVWAQEKIRKMCPDEDLSNIGKLMDNVESQIEVAIVMNKAAIMAERFERGEFVGEWGELNEVTRDEILYTANLNVLMTEIMTAINRDSQRTVEVEEESTKK